MKGSVCWFSEPLAYNGVGHSHPTTWKHVGNILATTCKHILRDLRRVLKNADASGKLQSGRVSLRGGKQLEDVLCFAERYRGTCFEHRQFLPIVHCCRCYCPPVAQEVSCTTFVWNGLCSSLTTVRLSLAQTRAGPPRGQRTS